MKRKIHHLQNGISTGPYKDLYIYHLSGQVAEKDEQTFDENFIGNWVEDDFSFLFFSTISDKLVYDLIKDRPDLYLIDNYHFTYEQWQGGGLKSVKIDNFFIIPPWEEDETDPGSVRIIMDPGVVFGTGFHPTTRDCLKAICHIKKYCSFRKVIDIGTGTGILAIASACLGAREVLAIDLNPLSIKTAKKNVKLNKLEDVIKVAEGRAEEFMDESADLVVANIHYEVIKKLLGHKGLLQKRHFVFSGLMRSQVGDIRDRIKKYNLMIFKEWDHEMTWYTLIAGKDSNE